MLIQKLLTLLKKVLSENGVTEIDKLNTFIEKNKFNFDTVKEALEEKLLLYGRGG